MVQQIEAVFENGVFRPLQPVHLPEQHRVTLLLSDPENVGHTEEPEMDQEVAYQPLPLRQCQTIRVKFRHGSDFGPLPYPIDEDDADTLDELEQA